MGTCAICLRQAPAGYRQCRGCIETWGVRDNLPEPGASRPGDREEPPLTEPERLRVAEEEREKYYVKARVYGAIARNHTVALEQIARGTARPAQMANEAPAWRHSERNGVPMVAIEEMGAALGAADERDAWRALAKKHALDVVNETGPELFDRYIIGLQEMVTKLLDERAATSATERHHLLAVAFAEAYIAHRDITAGATGRHTDPPCAARKASRPYERAASAALAAYKAARPTPVEPQSAPPGGDMWAELKAEVAELKREEAAVPRTAVTIPFSSDRDDLRETVRGIVREELDKDQSALRESIKRAARRVMGGKSDALKGGPR